MLKNSRRICLAIAVMFALFASFTASADEEFIVLERTHRMRHDGFDVEFWTQNRGEIGHMTLTGNGTFICEWEENFNILFRTGRKFPQPHIPYEDLGEIFIEYAVRDYRPVGNSYFTVYGWTVEPLIEFYIVEAWGNWRPPGGRSIDTVTIDGGVYEIYETLREDEPSILGRSTFPQYWSVRVVPKNMDFPFFEGKVSVTEHFRAWEAAGLEPMGAMWEVALCVEGFRSTGYAEVYHHVLTIGDEVIGTVKEVPLEDDEEITLPDEIETVEAASPPVTDEAGFTDELPLLPMVAAGAATIAFGGAAAYMSLKKKN
jgi:hypothetical protein